MPILREMFIFESPEDAPIPRRLEPAQEELVSRFADRLVAELGGPMDERNIGRCETILRELLVLSERAEGEPDEHMTKPGPHGGE